MLKRLRLDPSSNIVIVCKAIQDLLLDLRRDNVDAFVAGGFPRDLYLGKSPKDIDLYVRHRDYYEAFKSLFPKSKFKGYAKAATSEVQYQHQAITHQLEDVCSNGDYRVKPKIPINLIGVKDDLWPRDKFTTLDATKAIIEKYDLAICMIAITSAGMWCDDRFLEDVKNERHTVCRDFGEEYIRKHYERIKKKYPWPLDMPKPARKAKFKRDIDDEVPF